MVVSMISAHSKERKRRCVYSSYRLTIEPKQKKLPMSNSASSVMRLSTQHIRFSLLYILFFEEDTIANSASV